MNSTILKITTIFVFTLFIFSCKKDKNTNITAPDPGPPSAAWKIIDEMDGLTGNNITDIELDQYGSVWIASTKPYIELVDTIWYISNCSSLSRVNSNGAVLQKYDTITSPFYKSKILSFGFNPLGMLYFSGVFSGQTPGATNKIVVKNGGYLTYDYPYMGGFSVDNFHFNSGGLWFGTGLGMLMNFNNGVFTGYNSSNSVIQGLGVYDIQPYGNNGDFYFSASNHFYKSQNGQISELFYLNHGFWMDKDSHDNVWIVANISSPTANYELVKFDGVDTTIIETPIPSNSTDLVDLAVDIHDNIWIATESSSSNGASGLYKWTGQTWIHYTPDNSPLHSWLLTKLKVDNAGNLWIGSYDCGVIQLNEFGTRN